MTQIRQKARDYLQKGKFDKAIEEYKRLTGMESKNPNYLNELGDIYLKAGDNVQAVSSFEKAVIHYEKVALYNNAVAVCKKILRIVPNRLETVYKLGELRAKQKLDGEARAYFAQYLDSVMADADSVGMEIKDKLCGITEFVQDCEEILDKVATIFMSIGIKTSAFEIFSKLAVETERAGQARKCEGYRQKLDELKQTMTRDELAGVADSVQPAPGGETPDETSPPPEEEAPPPVEPSPEGEMPPAAGSGGGEAPPVEEMSPSAEPLPEAEVSPAMGPSPEGEMPPASEPPSEEAIGAEAGPPEAEEHAAAGPPEASPESGTFPPDEAYPPSDDRPAAGEEMSPGGEPEDETAAEAEEPEAAGDEPAREYRIDETAAEIAPEPAEQAPAAEGPDDQEEAAPEEHASGAGGETAEGTAEPSFETPPETDAPHGASPVPDPARAREEVEKADSPQDFKNLLRDDDTASGAEGLVEEITSDVEEDDHRSHYDLGLAYLEMALHTEAIKEFQIASRSEQLQIKSIEMIGYCFLKQNNPRLAVKQLRRGLELVKTADTDNLGIHYNLGLAYEMLGDLEKAREHFEEVYIVDISFRDIAEKMKKLSTVS